MCSGGLRVVLKQNTKNWLGSCCHQLKLDRVEVSFSFAWCCCVAAVQHASTTRKTTPVLERRVKYVSLKSQERLEYWTYWTYLTLLDTLGQIVD